MLVEKFDFLSEFRMVPLGQNSTIVENGINGKKGEKPREKKSPFLSVFFHYSESLFVLLSAFSLFYILFFCVFDCV